MLEDRDPAAIEPFFRLTPRYPHAIKTLYHLVQMPFLAVSWSAYAARLPSLIAGFLSLVLMIRAAEGFGLGPRSRFIPALLWAASPGFWSAAHLGRQEMMLTALMLSSWVLVSKRDRPWFGAFPLAAAVFVHPNAFIVALPAGLMLLRRRRPGDLAAFVGILGAAAALAVGASLLMDPDFFAHYRSFGESVGVGDTPMMKILGLPRFLAKMWRRQAGTYYLPDGRIMLIAAAAAPLGAVAASIRRRSLRSGTADGVLAGLGILAGWTVVGKYAPPSLVFIEPAVWILSSVALVGLLPQRRRCILAAAGLTAILALVSTGEVMRSWRDGPYRAYEEFIAESVGSRGRALGNLNAAFAVDPERLVIWRDLASLPEGRQAVEDLLRDWDIRWVLLPDELAYIHRRRPVWNDLYGNPRWYPGLDELLRERGELLDRAAFPNYAMRIVPLMGREDWFLSIYRIDQ